MAIRWSEEMDNRLREMVGTSSSIQAEILSKEFGYPYTRNMVIGRRGRLGLVTPADISSSRRRAAVVRNFGRIKLPIIKVDLAYEPPTEQLRTLMQLKPHHCRWPVGDPVMFCGATKQDESSYCAAHHARAHVPRPSPINPNTEATLRSTHAHPFREASRWAGNPSRLATG